MQKIVKIMLGNKAEEIGNIPLSNDTIQRILHLSDNIEENVVAKIPKKLLALQINELTDISNYIRATKGQGTFGILTTCLEKHSFWGD